MPSFRINTGRLLVIHIGGEVGVNILVWKTPYGAIDTLVERHATEESKWVHSGTFERFA